MCSESHWVSCACMKLMTLIVQLLVDVFRVAMSFMCLYEVDDFNLILFLLMCSESQWVSCACMKLMTLIVYLLVDVFRVAMSFMCLYEVVLLTWSNSLHVIELKRNCSSFTFNSHQSFMFHFFCSYTESGLPHIWSATYCFIHAASNLLLIKSVSPF